MKVFDAVRTSVNALGSAVYGTLKGVGNLFLRAVGLGKKEESGKITVGSYTPLETLTSPSVLVRNVRSREVEGTVLHPKEKVFKRERALDVAKLILTDEGKINLEALDVLPELIGRSSSASDEYDQELLGLVEALRDNKELREIIESVGEPISSKDNPTVDRLIRATLQLPNDEEIGKPEAQVAVLSALLSELRQGDVGSCFATSFTLHMKSCDVLRVAEDLKNIVEKGIINRELDGRRVKINVSDQMFSFPMQARISVRANGDIYCLGQKITKDELSAIVQELVDLGIIDDVQEAQDMMDDKVDRLQQRAQRGVEKLDENEMHRAGKKSGSTYLHVFVDGLIRKKSVLELEDFENFEKLDKLAGEINAMNKSGASLEELQVKIEEYQKLVDIVKPKEKQFEQYQNEKLAFYDKFNGVAENRLLRGWEYTVASMGQMDIKSLDKDMRLHRRDSGPVIYNDRVYRMISGPAEIDVEGRKLKSVITKLSELLGRTEDKKELRFDERFVKLFETRVHEMLVERLVLSFEKGEFVYFEKDAQGNILKDNVLDRPEKMLSVVAGLIREVGVELSPEIKYADYGEQIEKEFSSIVNSLADYVSDDPDYKEYALRVYLNGVLTFKMGDVFPDDKRIDELVSESRTGGNFVNLTKLTYGVEKPSARGLNPSNKIAFLTSIIELGRELKEKGYDISDRNFGLLVRSSGHGFRLKFNDPVINEAIGDSRSAKESAQEIIGKGEPVVLADLNYEVKGKHEFLCLNKSDDDEYKLTYMNEAGEFDEGATFSDLDRLTWIVLDDPSQYGVLPDNG